MVIVLPVKRFSHGKQRLAGALSVPERAELCRLMCAWMLAELSQLQSAQRVVVVSTEPALQEMAKGYAFDVFDTLVEPRSLNVDVDTALQRLAREGATDACVVHADLPLFTHTALAEVVDAHAQGADRQMTLVPDHAGMGTNVRLCRPVAAVPCNYGHFSYGQHRCAAAVLQLQVARHVSVSLGRDLDDEGDLLPVLQLAEQMHLSPRPPAIDFLRRVVRRLPSIGAAHACI